MFFISVANSMGFALRDSNLPNRENKLSYEEKYLGTETKEYCQKWKSTNVVTQQVGSNVATVPTIQVYQPEETVSITATLVTSYTGNDDPDDDRYYFEFEVDFALYANKIIQIKATQGTTIYLSEYQQGIDLDEDLADGNMLRLDYQNSEKPSDYTNFTIDYTTGIAFFFYIEAIFKKPNPQGDDEVFDNIDNKTLLEANIYRGLKLETDPLPAFLAEKIMVAGKHFYFSVNDLQFITDGIPDMKNDATNFVSLSWTLIQQNVLGVNTDNRELIDTGGETMNAIIPRASDSITTTWSFTIPVGYMMHVIYASHNASSLASYVLNVGTTISGTDIIDNAMGSIPLSGGLNLLPFLLHEQYPIEKIIYVTITGAGAIASIRAQLILNV